MSSENEIVRTQLGKTIRRKEAQGRRLGRQEEQLRRDAAALARKRGAIDAEVAELTAHIMDLGGFIEDDKKTKKEVK